MEEGAFPEFYFSTISLRGGRSRIPHRYDIQDTRLYYKAFMAIAGPNPVPKGGRATR